MLSYYVSLRSEFHVMMSVTISAYKRCLYEDSCLIYISCVCMHIVLLNTYFVVFLFCMSSFCVSCTQCCQFLLVVHLWKKKTYRCSLKENTTIVWYHAWNRKNTSLKNPKIEIDSAGHLFAYDGAIVRRSYRQ